MLATLAATLLIAPSMWLPEEQKGTNAPAKPASTDQIDAKREKELDGDREEGKRYAAEVEKELKLSTDQALFDRVDRIGQELAKIANKTHAIATWGDKKPTRFNYTFKVVQGTDVNAFSLPGGYIYVYEGLIKFAESDDELAGVLAHEIAHAAFRHVATLEREQSKLSAVTLPLILVSILSGRAGAGETLTLGSLVNQAAGSGWSVSAEQAADYGGFQYMIQSKWDPTGMLTMMERLAQKDKQESRVVDLGIYRSHPPSKERADSLTHYMNLASLPIRRSRVSSSSRTTVKPGDNGTVQVLFGNRRIVSLGGHDALQRADSMAQALNGVFDSSPDIWEVNSGEGGEILVRGKSAITLLPEDAEAQDTTLPNLKKETVQNLKHSLFNVGFRVWDVR